MKKGRDNGGEDSFLSLVPAPFYKPSDARTWITFTVRCFYNGGMALTISELPVEPGSGLQRHFPSGSQACRHTHSTGGEPPSRASCLGLAKGTLESRSTTRARLWLTRAGLAGFSPSGNRGREWWEEVKTEKHYTSSPRCRLHSGQPDRLQARPSRSAPSLSRSPTLVLSQPLHSTSGGWALR